MASRRRGWRGFFPATVLALWAVLVVRTIPPAWAQASPGSAQDQHSPILFRADEVEYDEQLALTVARGHVEISQNGLVLLADTVSYNQRTDTVTASGNVSFSQPTGEILFADFMELRDSMNEGFARNVRMLLADRSRLAANTA
ncbi:MAG: LPS-assembly protein LptD, partial [Acetobacteraceae bacterium]|nr:LPS-assembly protein LptD [Acetobacteraceae bacterium]